MSLYTTRDTCFSSYREYWPAETQPLAAQARAALPLARADVALLERRPEHDGGGGGGGGDGDGDGDGAGRAALAAHRAGGQQRAPHPHAALGHVACSAFAALHGPHVQHVVLCSSTGHAYVFEADHAHPTWTCCVGAPIKSVAAVRSSAGTTDLHLVLLSTPHGELYALFSRAAAPSWLPAALAAAPAPTELSPHVPPHVACSSPAFVVCPVRVPGHLAGGVVSLSSSPADRDVMRVFAGTADMRALVCALRPSASPAGLLEFELVVEVAWAVPGVPTCVASAAAQPWRASLARDGAGAAGQSLAASSSGAEAAAAEAGRRDAAVGGGDGPARARAIAGLGSGNVALLYEEEAADGGCSPRAEGGARTGGVVRLLHTAAVSAKEHVYDGTATVLELDPAERERDRDEERSDCVAVLVAAIAPPAAAPAAGRAAQTAPGPARYAAALEDGRVMVLCDNVLEWCIALEHQLAGAFVLDVTQDGRGELVACGMDGTTFVIDLAQNIVRYRFPERVSSFLAGLARMSVGAAAQPCLVYTTYADRVLLFHSLNIRSVGSVSITALMESVFEGVRVLKENANSLEWTLSEKASLVHSCLYHSVATSEHRAYRRMLQQRLEEIARDNERLEQELIEQRRSRSAASSPCD